MPEEKQDNQQEGSTSSKYNPSSLEDAAKIIAALEKRVAEREASEQAAKGNAKTLEERLIALEAAQLKKLEESGNYQELAKQRQMELESLKPMASRAEALEAIIRQSNERMIEQIPEGMRGIVPVEYAPEKLQDWLSKNVPMLSKPLAPSFDGGAGASAGAAVALQLSADERALAKRAGMTDEQYMQAKKRVTGG